MDLTFSLGLAFSVIYTSLFSLVRKNHINESLVLFNPSVNVPKSSTTSPNAGVVNFDHNSKVLIELYNLKKSIDYLNYSKALGDFSGAVSVPAMDYKSQLLKHVVSNSNTNLNSIVQVSTLNSQFNTTNINQLNLNTIDYSVLNTSDINTMLLNDHDLLDKSVQVAKLNNIAKQDR